MNMLKTLCELSAPSGNEESVRDYLIEQIKPYCQFEIDNIGNLIAFKKGANTPQKRVMLCAHMDEVGFIATYVTQDGYIAFSPLGGIDPRILSGARIRFLSGVCGVIDAVPVHLLDSEKRKAVPDTDAMLIDIGAKSREDALRLVRPGDAAVFCGEYETLGDGLVCSRAIDDRFGCLALLEMIRSELPYDTYFAFTVQEELGTRGAYCAAFGVDPDIAVIVETTTAADICGVEGEKRVCELGGGAVVSYMDRRTVYSKRLYELAFATARENGIPVQTKSLVAGGNDFGAVQGSRGGTEVIALSLPCRYLHSPSCVASEADIESLTRLLGALHAVLI